MLQLTQRSSRYSIDVLKEEARQLVEGGALSPHQPLYTLCQYIPGREWICVESELEQNDYLLRDPLIDLIGDVNWEND